MKTTYERPHLRRGLPGRGVSPIGWLQTELAIGNQVHIPLLRSQVRQKRPARRFQAPSDCVTRLRARPRFPSRAGTSCVAGASTARSRVGQPSPHDTQPTSKATTERRDAARAESTLVSQRSQHPGVVNRHPSGPRPQDVQPSRQSQRVQLASGSFAPAPSPLARFQS